MLSWNAEGYLIRINLPLTCHPNPLLQSSWLSWKKVCRLTKRNPSLVAFSLPEFTMRMAEFEEHRWTIAVPLL